MRHHALQLIALEARRGAARHRDGRIGGRVAGRERVDAIFIFEDVHLRHRDARGDRHLLDHVVQAPQRRVAGVAIEADAAERARHHATTGAQAQCLEEARATDDGQRHDGGDQDGARGCRAGFREPEQHDHHRVDGRDHQRHRNEEGEQQPARRATRCFLAGVEIHALLVR
jgi:hypothetical protein